MLPRRLTSTVRPLAQVIRSTGRATITPVQTRFASQADIEDPNMNGGYINPPRVKRQFRDPYGDWWDKQERRNYGEPVHEDNDILVLLGTFVTAVFGLCAVVYPFYPDLPAIPRHYEGGLDKELGGAGAVPAFSTEEQAVESIGNASEDAEE